MTDAPAPAVLVEQFTVFAGGDGWPHISCPAGDWISPDDEIYTVGELLTAARRHISEQHPGGDALAHERAYTAVLHAVDAATDGDPYPYLVPGIPQLGDATCDDCGRTVRRPRLPFLLDDGSTVMLGSGCFRRRLTAVRRKRDERDQLAVEGGDA